MEVFESANIGNSTLKNRIIRSATFEGMCDKNGFPNDEYFELYTNLAKNNIGGLITGFSYISKEGKAMQPGQAGIDSADKIPYYKKLTEEIHKYDCKIFMQIAHTGRQTRRVDTGYEVIGPSNKRSRYFKEKPRKLKTEEVYRIIEKFGDSAVYTKESGFDGVQLHAAHGYLIHQFILPNINKRNDIFKVDLQTNIGTTFLDMIIDNVRKKCGSNYPILVKISSSDDFFNKFSESQLVNLIKFLEIKKVDAIEISYGTMDRPMNIFRGDFPEDLILSKNPIFGTDNRLMKFLFKTIVFPIYKIKTKSFTPMYNLYKANLAKKHTSIPIISVGGFRKKEEIVTAVVKNKIDFIGLSRALINEPDFVIKINNNGTYYSNCVNCNFCAIMCDTNNFTKCHQKQKNENK